MKRAAALALFGAAAAFPQCALCYRTAQALSTARARVLNSGIVVLGAPPLVLLGGFAFLLYRRNQR